jgi:hypothetical protein
MRPLASSVSGTASPVVDPKVILRRCEGGNGSIDILLYQVSVDGDRRCRPGAGRSDHLSTRVGHVAGRPDAGHAGQPAAVDEREAGLQLAAQAG